MKLTVLSENAALYPGLEVEFGLSVYLEEGDTRLLFDAGERDACLRNAEKLGIDLRRVTAVAFSHNHRDHCGGFLRLAEQLPPDVPIYAHSGFFIRKWWDHLVSSESVYHSFPMTSRKTSPLQFNTPML